MASQIKNNKSYSNSKIENFDAGFQIQYSNFNVLILRNVKNVIISRCNINCLIILDCGFPNVANCNIHIFINDYIDDLNLCDNCVIDYNIGVFDVNSYGYNNTLKYEEIIEYEGYDEDDHIDMNKILLFDEKYMKNVCESLIKLQLYGPNTYKTVLEVMEYHKLSLLKIMIKNKLLNC